LSVYVTAEEAIASLREGRFLILVDSHERENEGDLIVAAEHLTASKAAFMMREARGMFLLSTTQHHLRQLGIPLIEPRGGDVRMTPRMGLPFDARRGIRTGIAAVDRAETVRQALLPGAAADDFVIPGHVQPLAEHEEGLAARQGHTEGSVGLVRLAGLFPAAMMSEVLTDDGQMAGRQDLEAFAARHGIGIVTVEDVVDRAVASSDQPAS
jgi:3,4-dihydroxy-2-butanone 4-phosphate synthase